LTRNKMIIDQIQADKHNIQVLVDMLPTAKKTQYNKIQNTIKNLVKEIRYQKNLIHENTYNSQKICVKPLFEVEPSELKQDLDDISSFFGLIEDID